MKNSLIVTSPEWQRPYSLLRTWDKNRGLGTSIEGTWSLALIRFVLVILFPLGAKHKLATSNSCADGILAADQSRNRRRCLVFLVVWFFLLFIDRFWPSTSEFCLVIESCRLCWIQIPPQHIAVLCGTSFLVIMVGYSDGHRSLCNLRSYNHV